MSISDVAIRKPVFAWMIMAALIIFGAIAFTRLGVSQMPDVDFPVVNVSLSLQGAAPEVMESQVVDVVEDAVMGIQGISNVSSTSRQGSANISIEFDIDQDIDTAVQEVQSRVAQVQALLPADLDAPSIRKTNPEDQPIVWLVLLTDGTFSRYEQNIYARDVLFDQFSTVDGVGDIALAGYVDPNLRVWLSRDKLAAGELGVTDIINSIKANHQEIPAGRIENDKTESNIRIMGEAVTPGDFGKIPITFRGGGANYRTPPLSTVSTIEEGLADIRKIARFNGEQAIGLGILKQHGSNAIDVVDKVRAKVALVQPTLPKGLRLEIRNDSTRFIQESVNELCFALIMSALLTSLVCFFFLGSWSSTFNVLMAIPTSIIGAFLVIWFFGFTLNTFTLLGLSLAIGIVVDDAIMMLENIMRHFGLGKPRMQAAIEGANEITFAAVAATIAVVAIFMPVIFMKGIIGRYLYQYGITVTAAVMLSLLEALTLTPMRSSRFMRANEHRSKITSWMEPLLEKTTAMYSRILEICLRFRWITVGTALAIFGVSLLLFKKLPGEMMPAQDQSQFTLRMKVRVGASLPFTDGKTREVEDFLRTIPEISGFYTTVGGFGGDAVNEAQMFVTLVPINQRKRSQAQIMEQIRDKYKPPGGGGGGGGKAGGRRGSGKPKAEDREKTAGKATQSSATPAAVVSVNGAPAVAPPTETAPAGAGGRGTGGGGGRRGGVTGDNMQVNVQDMSLRGLSSGRGFPIEFTVQGPDWDTLGKSTIDLIEKIEATGVAVDVNTDYSVNTPEIDLMPDREKAARYDVPIQSIAQTLNSLVGGAVMGSQTRYLKNGHRYDIRVRLQADERTQPDDLSKLLVRNSHGEVIPLKNLVTVKEQPSLQLISRYNRERSIKVYGNMAPGHTQAEAIKLVEEVAKKELPSGYHIRITGSSQTFRESMESLALAMILGLIVSYMVLASQFNSFVHPATVLMALPFSISGAIFALLIGHQSINMFSMIGLILLMGIVKKNSILLVEFTNHLRAQGVPPREAILQACPVRLRPILMTSIATVAGAIPEAFAIGPGAENLIPMATAIIGGVIASTLLTLLVVPCVYSLFLKLERAPVTH